MCFLQVAVIGNACLEDASVIKQAQDVGRLIAQLDYHLVCGGLKGVMLESCRGFKSVSSNRNTIGILPGYKAFDANEFVDIIIPTGLDLGRNQLVVASSFAVVVIGGGAGTLSEIALASQINKPIILMKGSGGWADQFTQVYLDERRNAPLHHVHTLDELSDLLQLFTLQADKSGAVNSGHNR